MNESLKMVFVLVLIVMVSTVLLMFANNLTKERIELNSMEKASRYEKLLFPDATGFEDKEEYKEFYNDKILIGYGVGSAVFGYTSEIKILVGFNPDKSIKKVFVVEQQETPGLGAMVVEDKFLSQFKDLEVQRIAEVDGVTGATVSSNAVKAAVKNAYEKIK